MSWRLFLIGFLSALSAFAQPIPPACGKSCECSTPLASGTAGQTCVIGTSQYLCHTTGACAVAGDWTLIGPSAGGGISACATNPPTAGTAGQVCVTGTSQYLCHTTGACSVAGDWTLVGPSGLDILRFGICIAAGCGSETTINYIATMGAGSFTECAFNLATAATGSSVIVDVEDASGASIFGATKLVVTVANGTAVEYQSTFANSPQTYARGSKYKAVILQNDSGGAAQGGTVQCR